MRELIIDGWHSAADGLTMTAFSLGTPDIRENYVEVPGMSGSLDYSESSGSITYTRRPLSATFECSVGSVADRQALFDTLVARFHGKTCKIICPDDPMHYVVGRVSFKMDFNHLRWGQLSLQSSCEPWRYDLIPQHAILPYHSSADNFAKMANLTAEEEVSTAPAGIIGETAMAALCLSVHPADPHTYAVFRFHCQPNTTMYVSASIKNNDITGRGYWRVSASKNGKKQMPTVIETDDTGDIYLWIYRLSTVGNVVLQNIIITPTSNCAVLQNGCVSVTPSIDRYNALLSIGGVSCTTLQTPAQIPAGEALAIAMHFDDTTDGSIHLSWERRVI